MRRKGLYKPTIEDIVELSGIEMLHPGGLALTRRTAEVADLRQDMKVLDVSSGRGTPAIFYAKEYDCDVTGIDIAEKMVNEATKNAKKAGLDTKVQFKLGDSQELPFEDNEFDVVINECAVGIPDDSQKVLDEMVRVAKPGGVIVVHETTWKKNVPDKEKEELSERYGTTPLEYDEWIAMLRKAGVRKITTELERWSKPEIFWQMRINRQVSHPSKIFSRIEKLGIFFKIISKYGLSGLKTALQNEKVFINTALDRKLGYCLYKGIKGS
ncbi:MAG: class I SAM-dependent methyltransferase [Promethearchaeota archaeon]